MRRKEEEVKAQIDANFNEIYTRLETRRAGLHSDVRGRLVPLDLERTDRHHLRICLCIKQ